MVLVEVNANLVFSGRCFTGPDHIFDRIVADRAYVHVDVQFPTTFTLLVVEVNPLADGQNTCMSRSL